LLLSSSIFWDLVKFAAQRASAIHPQGVKNDGTLCLRRAQNADEAEKIGLA
jgi:hypothetical protein